MSVPIKLKLKYRDTSFNYKSQKSPGGNSGRNKKKKAVDKKGLPPQIQKILYVRAGGGGRVFVTAEELEAIRAK